MAACSTSGTHVCTSCGVGAWVCTIEDGDCKGGGTCSGCAREQYLDEMLKDYANTVELIADEWELHGILERD